MIPYAHVVQAVYFRPWAIQRAMHDQIRAILRVHMERGHMSAEEVQERLAAAPRRVQSSTPTSIALIPIQGVIMPKANIMADMSGGTSVERLRSQVRGALADGDIEGIVFDVDSPGGMVDQVPELAAEIRASRGQKPMVAVCNTIAASAAYWLASQADEVVITPSGEAGSIGVFTSHEDWSKWWANEGIATTLISAGKFKVEASEFEPLTDEAKAHIQSQVDDYYGMFIRDVAAGRGTTAAAVREGYGQGRMLTAKDAVTAGLADRVATIEDAITRVAREAAASRRNAAAAPAIVKVALEQEPDEDLAAQLAAAADPEPDEEPIAAVAAGPAPEFYRLRSRRRDRG